MVDLSIVIISWNAKKHLEKCLESIKNSNYKCDLEIVVFDNGSKDGSQGMVESMYPDVKLIKSPDNLGFAKANNIAIKETKGRLICLLNSDVEIGKYCFDQLIDIIEDNKKIGIIGPKVLNSDGSLQFSYRDFPNYRNTLLRAFGLHKPCIISNMRNIELNGYFNVDVLSGCFWIVRKKAFYQIGGLDEQFYIYGEDLDLCKRMWDYGWYVRYVPSVKIVHHGGASSSNAPIKFYIEQQKTSIQYWKKHKTKNELYVYISIIIIHHFLRIIAFSITSIIRCNLNDSERYKIKRSYLVLKELKKLIKCGSKLYKVKREE